MWSVVSAATWSVDRADKSAVDSVARLAVDRACTWLVFSAVSWSVTRGVFIFACPKLWEKLGRYGNGISVYYFFTASSPV